MAASRLSAAPGLFHRAECFGSFVWTADRTAFFRLDGIDAVLFEIFAYGRTVDLRESDLSAIIATGHVHTVGELNARLTTLRDSGLLVSSFDASNNGTSTPIKEILELFSNSRRSLSTAKPLWAHLQPFTFCNLECVHCYCNSSPRASRLQLPVNKWFEIIDTLDVYGIADVYITGGETLIIPETWLLMQQITKRGMSSGLSTNALFIDDEILYRLEEFRVGRLQVSLDGGCSETHDFLRNRPGAFAKTIANIERLSAVTEPVINTVVNRKNIEELSAIVSLGKSIGVKRYKFFPQKVCGRGVALRCDTLNDVEILQTLVPACQKLALTEAVEVETVDLTISCGSGRSGFAVDELGDVYPCIFGIADRSQKAENLIVTSLDHIWFDSASMKSKRVSDIRPCHACEMK